jgi:hypothetical protein
MAAPVLRRMWRASTSCIRRDKEGGGGGGGGEMWTWMVKVNACPACRLPVTLGGGIKMLNGTDPSRVTSFSIANVLLTAQRFRTCAARES